MSLKTQIYDGHRAREVLENEQFQKAFVTIEQQIIEKWKNTPARDTAGREKLWDYLKLSRTLKEHLEQTIESGKLAEVNLNHQRSIADRLKIW